MLEFFLMFVAITAALLIMHGNTDTDYHKSDIDK